MFDLGAQSLHVDVDETGVTGVAVAPHLLQQHLAGEDLPRLARERDQQVELQRGERERLAVALDRVAPTSMTKSPISSRSGSGSSPRRNRARIRAISSCGLKGLTT